MGFISDVAIEGGGSRSLQNKQDRQHPQFESEPVDSVLDVTNLLFPCLFLTTILNTRYLLFSII